MRNTLLLLVLAVPAGGCVRIAPVSGRAVSGSASYAATPPLAGASGASPLQAVFCSQDTRSGLVSIRLGDRCALSGPWVGGGRGVYGGTAQLASAEECALPFADGVSPVHVRSATLAVFGDAVDATVGGVTAAGTYVTYHFSGARGERAPEGACGEPKAKTMTPERVHFVPARGTWESGEATR